MDFGCSRRQVFGFKVSRRVRRFELNVQHDIPVHEASSATQKGVDPFLWALARVSVAVYLTGRPKNPKPRTPPHVEDVKATPRAKPFGE